MGTRGRGFLAALTLEERAGLGASSLECLAGPQPGQARPCACPELRSAGNASHPLGKHWSHLTLLARPLCPPAWGGRPGAGAGPVPTLGCGLFHVSPFR